ncbi:MAG: TonB-dependent receptor [Cytophagales bacterium]|nr:TonB-dependent receptor [Cytophagales bacterium]
MGLKLTKKILKVCGYVFFGVSVQFIFYTLVLAEPSWAQQKSLEEVHITIELHNSSVREALEKLEEATDFEFAYKRKIVDSRARLNFKRQHTSLANLLRIISRETNLGFKRVNEIIYVNKKAARSVAEVSDYLVAQEKTITGKVISSEDNEGLPGVNVVIKGTTAGTVTDIEGNYRIDVPDAETILVFSSVGFVTEEMPVGMKTIIDVNLAPDLKALEEIVVVGYGTQKKEAVVGAMTSVKPAELKIPASNLTTALAGRLSGVVSYQTSGEPGADNAQFFVRGVASFNGQNGPLILIDGVELTVDDLARLQPDDIESFSVLKDPTTTAIYGARGANGIILVTTKTGEDGPAVVNLRIENSISEPVSLLDLADPITHMRLQNEADRTRGDFPTFTEEKIAGTARGGNPNVYPAIDWYEALFKDYAFTTRVNLNVRGGGKKARYYVAGSLNRDNGLLQVDKTNNFTNNIKLNRYLLRSNININLHENTEMIVRLHSTIDDYRGPLQGGNAIYNAAVRTSPVRFPAVLEPDESLRGVPHITFGNDLGPRFSTFRDNGAVWYNPYAELQRGYKDFRRQLSLVQLEFKQDLGSVLPGLSARFLGNANTTSSFENRRAYRPFFYRVSSFDPVTDAYTLVRTSEGDESLELERGATTNNSVLYMEAALNYHNTFAEKHNVSGLLVFTGREFLDGNASTVQLSLPSRNLMLAGRYNYDYDNRYFAEFNFGYNGSERFARDNRFGFFPSFGIGWLISDEPFFQGLSGAISRLKLRASYGWVGNDRIGNTRNDRFFYLSEVDIDAAGRGATFGRMLNERINGVAIRRYANPLVTWETSRKINLGLELNLFDDAVQFRADVFEDNRTNILQTRADIPSTLGLQASLQTNVGEVTSKGIDASLDINHYFNNDLWVTARSTFVFADNEYTVFEEPNYAAIGAPWRSNIGNNVTVAQGYIAERLFVDDEEALNSPVQFGTPGVDYGGGDIKYKDLNNDGVITTLDRAPIGKPGIPKITYGFGFSAGYKRFDFNVFFQGLAETSFFINPINTGPFINSVRNGFTIQGGNGTLSENGLLQAYADSHWSEENKDIYALWPRLSTTVIENNVQRSTWWLRDGSFLRLKQVEVGYNLLKNPDNKLGISTLRVYASGTNLFNWSEFGLWDPELKGNGLNYPLQRVINLGVHVGF